MKLNFNFIDRSDLPHDVLLSFAIGIIFIFLWSGSNLDSEHEKNVNIAQQELEPFCYNSNLIFGFDKREKFIDSYKLEQGKFLGDMLYYQGVNNKTIVELEQKSKDVYNVRKLRAGKDIHFIKNDECDDPHCFVYEPNPFSYVVFNLKDSIYVEEIERPVETRIREVQGEIQTSLWDAMITNDLPESLIDKMEDALSWSVNFYHTQAGDQFKLIYEEMLIEEEVVGVGNILGAYYKNDKEHYAVYHENDTYKGHYDLEGRPTKKAFLKAPVRASRISSRYNRRRFHPVLKRVKPHLGTDYAAPRGTPIIAVADGVISKASYTRGNGKYIKIRHDKVYETQYLHMSRFAKGIKPGVSVSQGQTIGFVGSTGLATGPHVCFRFWKNKRQVDHLRMNFPAPDPMPEEQLPAYFELRDKIVSQLDHIDSVPLAQKPVL